MTEITASQRRNHMVMAAIFLLFLLPLLVAWFMVNYMKNSHNTGAGAQHGILINPPRALENLDLVDPVVHVKTPLYGKWTMFAMISGDCNQDCKEVLYRMRQIRLAMGEHVSRVQRAVYFEKQDVEKDAKNIFSGYEGQLILTRDKTGLDFRENFLVDDKRPDHAIYLIDPRGFLMMCYPKDTNPTGIIKDLKRLLRTTG